MAKKKKFNTKIWAKKILIETLKVLITGLIVIWQKDTRFLALIPLLKAIENYIKNK